jgi:outer membrane protein OmpA-like peptidoglycan-associated protein
MLKIVCAAIFLAGLLHFQAAYAITGDQPCGLYELTGTIEKNNAAVGYAYIVNKGTRSQFTITIPIELEPRLAPYFERTSKLRARFSEKIEGFRGEFNSIESAERAISDPLGYSNQRTLVLLAEEKCVKKTVPEFETIYFNIDTSKIAPYSQADLEFNVKILLKHKDIRVRIEGHTDENCSVEFCYGLGEAKAKAVMNRLIEFGINADRLTTVSFGKDKPADPGHDANARAKNNRVEFSIISNVRNVL